MYSGTTFRHHSGNIMGAHQRIDRIAKHALLRKIGTHAFFPSIKTILHFEGKNGPDGIKSKSPSIDEPWHFIAPDADENAPLVGTIKDHLYNLSRALKKGDEVRAGFEAAWLSHAIVDGLTPAHHYPLAEKIEELWGKAHSERSSRRDKIIIKGKNGRDMISKNWQYWGAGGVFTAHFLYEWGVASSMMVGKFKSVSITQAEYDAVLKDGYIKYFLASVRAVDDLKTYEEFGKTGWSPYLGQVTRKKLAPILIKNVALAWYAAEKGRVE